MFIEQYYLSLLNQLNTINIISYEYYINNYTLLMCYMICVYILNHELVYISVE